MSSMCALTFYFVFVFSLFLWLIEEVKEEVIVERYSGNELNIFWIYHFYANKNIDLCPG